SCARAEHQHLRVEFVDVERILAHDVLLQLVQHEILHTRPPIRFAESVNARVGFDFDEVPVPGAAHDHALDVRDLDLALEAGGFEMQRQRAPHSAARGLKKSSPVHKKSRNHCIVGCEYNGRNMRTLKSIAIAGALCAAAFYAGQEHGKAAMAGRVFELRTY